MKARPVRDDDLPRLAADAARYQADRTRATSYLSLDQQSILTELEELERPFVGSLVERDGLLDGWIIGELDLDVGRVWWLGPFSGDAATADTVYVAAKNQLPSEIDQEEMAADVTNREYRAFAERHGFINGPASIALRRRIDLELPPTRSDAVVRLAEAADRDALAALHEASFPHGHYTGAGLLDRAPHTVFVASLAGGVAGYIAVERQADDSAYIDFVGVDPTHRRSGLATDLVIAACRWARSETLSHVHLTVRETLEGARALYESLGFEPEMVLVPYRKGFAIE